MYTTEDGVTKVEVTFDNDDVIISIGYRVKSLRGTQFNIATEVIYQRADADKDNMGLTTWSGNHIERSDLEVAKNYLDEK